MGFNEASSSRTRHIFLLNRERLLLSSSTILIIVESPVGIG